MESDQFGPETMFYSEIPRDIVIEILLRLPVKSLLRFRSVSKPLCSLIKNPIFISKILITKNSQQKPPHLLVMGQHHETLDVTLRLIFTKHGHNNIPPPPLHVNVPFFEITSEKTRMAGSVNGLVCMNLVNHNGVAIVIWNPAMKTFRSVPKSPHVSTLGELTVTDLGFGYHPMNDDYMVVRLLHVVATPRRRYEVEVYTLSTNSWRKITMSDHNRILCVISPFYKPMAPGMVAVNGVIFWIGVEIRDEEMCSVVVSLEMSNEKLNFIKPPIEHHGIMVDLREEITLRLFNLNEWLGLIYSENSGSEVDVWMKSGFDIWVLNEGVESRWTKMLKVEPSDQGLVLEAGFWENLKALVAHKRKEMYFDENGDYVYTKGETQLFLYDVVKSEIVTRIANHELRGPFQAYSYVESLVALKGGVNVAKEVLDLSKLLDYDPLLF